MSLSGKLARWQEAGVIDAATAARIDAFEHHKRRPIVLYAMAALGAGTVALGLISIVAANWEGISANVKLGCDLLLGAALAFGTYRVATRKLNLATDVLVTLYYGFTLASLALVGQVYQLNTPTYQALLVWSLFTLPLVLLAQSRYVASLAVAGWVVTHGYALGEFIEYVERTTGFDQAVERNLLAVVFFVSPFVYVLLGRIPWLRRERPEHAWALTKAGLNGVLLGGFGLQFLWYETIGASDTLSWALLVTAFLSAGLGAALTRASSVSLQARVGFGMAIAFIWLSLVVATSFARGDAAFVGAIVQVAWIALWAWIALQLGMLRSFNTLTGLLALRVLVVYFEVFGSLLDTGLGLITGGALTLLMAWLWRNKTRDLAERLMPSRSTDHVA